MAECVLDFKEIGYRIKTRRIKQGILQTEFGKMLDISQTHMSNIESGKAGVTLENLVKMVNIFDCSIDELVFGEKGRPPDGNGDLKNYTVEDFLKALEVLKALKP